MLLYDESKPGTSDSKETPTLSSFNVGAETSFPIVIDSGATESVLYIKDPIRPSPYHQMKGLAKTLDITGKGTTQWNINDDIREVTTIKTEAYYVPGMTMCLLSPKAYFHHIQHGHSIVQPNHVQPYWSPKKVFMVPCNPVQYLEPM